MKEMLVVDYLGVGAKECKEWVLAGPFHPTVPI